MTQRHPIKDDFAPGANNPPFAPDLLGWISIEPAASAFGRAWLHDGYGGSNAPAGRQTATASADMQDGTPSDPCAWIRREEFQADQEVSAQFYVSRLPTSSKQVLASHVDGFSVLGRVYGGTKSGTGRDFRYEDADAYVFTIQGTATDELDVTLQRYNLGSLTTVATVQLDAAEAALCDFTETFRLRMSLIDGTLGVDYKCWIEEFVCGGQRTRSRLLLSGTDETVRNLVGYSEDLTETSWGSHGWRTSSGGTGTVTTVSKTNPKGSATTNLLNDTDGAATFIVDHEFTGLTDGQDYVFSIFMDEDTASKMAISVQHTGGTKNVISTYTVASRSVNVTKLASAQGGGDFYHGPQGFIRLYATATYDASHAADAGLTVGISPSASAASATNQSWADMAQFEEGSETDGTSLPTAYQAVLDDGLTNPLTNSGRCGFGMASDRQYVAGERDLVDHCDWWEVSKPTGAVLFREEWSRIDAAVSHQITDGLGTSGRLLQGDYTFDIYSSQAGVIAPDGAGGVEWDPANSGIENVPFLRLVPDSSNVYQRRTIQVERRDGTTTDFLGNGIMLRGSYPGVSGQPAIETTTIRWLPYYVGYVLWFFTGSGATDFVQLYQYSGAASGQPVSLGGTSGSFITPGNGNLYVFGYDARPAPGLPPLGDAETAYVEHRAYIDGVLIPFTNGGLDVDVQADGSLLDRTAARTTGWGTGFAGIADDTTRSLRFDDFARGLTGATSETIVVATEGAPSIVLNDFLPIHFGYTEATVRPSRRVAADGGHAMSWPEFSDGSGGVAERRVWTFEAPTTTPEEHRSVESFFDDILGGEYAFYFDDKDGNRIAVGFQGSSLDRVGREVGAYGLASFEMIELLNLDP